MRKKKVTSNDIAKQLGVSRTLVSFVLNGRSNEKRISPEMAKKVFELAEKLNYIPNHQAKSLKTGRSMTLGLIVADISNPFFSKLARFIEHEAFQRGYSVIFCSSDENRENFIAHLENLKKKNVDGFLLTPPIGSEKAIITLKKQQIPYVLIDRIFEGVDSHSVTIDNYQTAYDATIRLIKNCKQNIALINVNNELLTMKQRTQGYYAAMIDSGLNIKSTLVKQLKFSHEADEVYSVLKEVVRNGADAILFTTNKLGVAGIQFLRKLGVNIPEDIAVLSFDDTDAYAVAFSPISAIRQPLGRISKEAIEILVDMIEGDTKKNVYKHVVLDAEFIIRKSCY